MDQKKRRNSILKKPPATDDETTGEITTKLKRRISFSGKKSVKEFLAGEEQATIWGTSYEESAEFLHANTTESAVVPVNDKRIVLRNRRVVVDTNRSNKRRSKKQVQVAENDKENVFMPTPQVEVEATNIPAQYEAVRKADSPEKSELAIVKPQVQSAKIIKSQLDSLSAFSTTFDFINNSGAVNKSVTIEHSVDVSLDEKELEMYKFRVPVSSQDVSPNLSVCREGSSPNIFSGSILMSDEEMYALKVLKAQVGGLISKGGTLKMIAQPDTLAGREDKQMNVVDVHNAADNLAGDALQKQQMKENPKRKTITATVDMETVGVKDGGKTDAVGKSLESNSLKRKTITSTLKMDESTLWPNTTVKTHATVIDITAIDLHSPLRKKPMHNHMNKTMDISAVVPDGQAGLLRRQTIHFEGADVDETAYDAEKPNKVSVFRQTIHFDQNQIHEDTICQENEVPPTTRDDDPLPMELSFSSAENGGIVPQESAKKTTKKRHSIHGPVDMLEDSPKKDAKEVDVEIPDLQKKSFYSQMTIVADSESPQLRRESMYAPTDMVEESPKYTKEPQTQKPKDRQTVYNSDMAPEVSMSFAMVSTNKSGVRSTAWKTIVAPDDMDFDTHEDQKSSNDPSDVDAAVHCDGFSTRGTTEKKKSIYVPCDMLEESTYYGRQNSIQQAGQGTSFKQEEFVYAPSDGNDRHSKSAVTSINKRKVFAPRNSIYTQADMVEESPRMQKVFDVGASAQGNCRKSTYALTDMIEESPKVQKAIESDQSFEGSKCGRKSIYTASNMAEDSVCVLKEKTRGNERKSIYTHADMIEDSPKVQKTADACKPNENKHLGGLGNDRKSIYIPSNMVEDSPKMQNTVDVFKSNSDPAREAHANLEKSIITPSDIPLDTPKEKAMEESYKPNKDLDHGRLGNVRKSIYTLSDMIEDSPIIQKTVDVSKANADLTSGANADTRKSLFTSSDIVDDTQKVQKIVESRRANQNLTYGMPENVRKSIYTPLDMVEDSPKQQKTVDVSKPIADFAPEAYGNSRKSIFTPSDMIEEPPETINRPLDRKSIYTPTPMEEDSSGLAKPIEKNQNFKNVRLSGKSIFTATYIAEDTPELQNLEGISQNADLQGTARRRSNYNTEDITEDSPPIVSKAAPHCEILAANARKSLYKSDMVEDSFELLEAGKSLSKSSHRHPVLHTQRTLRNSEIAEQVSHPTDFAPVSIFEDSLSEEAKFKVQPNESQSNVRNRGTQTAMSRQTNCVAAEILEDSPPKQSTVGSSHATQSAIPLCQEGSNSKISKHQVVNGLQNTNLKATDRKTICAPIDIQEDSICTPVVIMEDSPKPPDPHPSPLAAPKVIVRHMTLQQGVLGESAAMRVLQKQQTKAKVVEPVQMDESALEMSIVESAPVRTSPSNFLKLNEQIIRGEVKALDDERKGKKSLFDRLEMIETEVPHFDSFQNKSIAVAPGYMVQPRKSCVNDYTMDFTSNTFDGQRRRGSEYTIDLSSNTQRADDIRNLSHQISPVSGGAPKSKDQLLRPGQSKRQTMHFEDENEMDLSSSGALQEVAKIGLNRKTIHFHDHLELDTSRTQTNSNRAAAAAFEKNPKTIYFHENNQVEETKTLPTVRAKGVVQDTSAMDASIQEDGPNKDPTPYHASETSCQQNLMRQSCIVQASSLDTGSQSTVSNRQKSFAAAAVLEVTRSQTNEPQNASMDLSASLCPQFSELKFTLESQLKSISALQRRTIHCNDDLELDDTGADCLSYREASCSTQQKPGRAEIEEPTVYQAAPEQARPSGIPTRIISRKTIHFNQDLEVDNDKAGQATSDPKMCTKRQTIYTQQNIDMDESLMEPPRAAKADVELHSKEDVSKPLPKPRRMKTCDELPVEVDDATEKFTMRKSSFSRTLNFGEVTKAMSKFQTVDENESTPIRPRLKRHESTTEIDRSLAEYLKAEAAADNTSDDVAEREICSTTSSEYYDAVAEQVEREQFTSDWHTDHKQPPMLEESGMQPLQRTGSRRDIEKCVSDERALNQDEPENDQMDMSFEPRGMLANRLNHEFFDKEVFMSPKPEENNQSTWKMHANVRRQTILQPEAMMEQSDIEVMGPEKPLEPKEVDSQPNRKTIHFTSEDAVDESFFDENLCKPTAQTKPQSNRHTVYFNESQNSIGTMDTSFEQDKPEIQTRRFTIGKSKAAQTMKEILRESNILFAQSMLRSPFYDAKHSTIRFNAKDISLETAPVSEALKTQDENLECTPTKTNKSRIPQLIGSAKKLQSMKKSMEFIQEKLPNLSCSAPANKDDAVATEVNPTTEEHNFSCEPKEIHDDSHAPAQLQESFETVEIPRRATTFQRNDTLYLCQNEVDLTNISHKSNYRFEDVPITISDVSTYFVQKLPPSAEPQNEVACSANTTEALCNLDINKIADETQLPKSCDSDDTTYNFAMFKKRYVELTSESITSTGIEDDIEKTHLSLVNTLDENESEMVRDRCSEQQLQAVGPPLLETTKFSSSVCRKCKGDKRSVSQNDTTLGSFHLPPLRGYEMKLDVLRGLRDKPRLSAVANIWTQNLRQSDSFSLSDARSLFDLTDTDSLDGFKESLEEKRRIAARQGQKKEFQQEASFLETVQKKLQGQKTNWILNDLLLMQNILKFTHTRIRTFAIFITFTPKDGRGVEVEFNEIRILPNNHQSRTWAAFDYVLHYQMLVELPFSLIMHYPKSENLFQLLDHVESVTQEVLKTGKDMMFHILTSPATLIRESTGPIYIRKLARTRTAQNEVKHKEFQIEVMNMKKLSYESITMPPLYEFDEKVQLLPTGPDFLRVFLADPLRYLKT